VIGGLLVHHVATKWVLAALGFGEGPAYPVAPHAAYK
jgi:hypothetical protein